MRVQQTRKERKKQPEAGRAYTPEEVGARLQISVKTVLKMANAGEIPGFRCGRLWRFPCAAIDDLAGIRGIK